MVNTTMKTFFLSVGLAAAAAAASGPFAPYITSRPPDVVRILGEEVRGGVKLQRVVFFSRTAQTSGGGIRSEVFAAIARPARQGRYPGILILHGGGGAAEVEKAIEWAGRGYVALAPDLPGIGNPKRLVNSSGAWKQFDYGRNHFLVVPDITACGIFDGVLAGLQSLHLLRAQPDVVPNRVGVTGVSWGGYCAVMVAGLGGKAVAAAFSIYGSGHFDLGSAFQRDLARLPAEQAAEWLNRLDARNYAPGIRARFFEAAAANDTYFWPPAVTATLADIQSPKNQLIAPNADHWLNLPGGCERNKEKPWHDNGWMAMQGTYFDYLLKGQGRPFPELRDARMVRSSDGSQVVRFRVKNAVHLTAIEVWHSSTGEPWKSRKWIPIMAARHGNWYQASVPAGRDSIVLVSDDRPVTVSSRVLLWRQ